MNWLKALVLLIIPSILFSCAGKKPEFPDPEWKFQKSGIVLRYTSSNELNLFNDNPHTIITGVYQLSNKAGFEEISKSREGIISLLNLKDPTKSKSIEIEGAEKFDSFVVSPGETKKIVMDRVENVKWVGIISGYFSLDPKKSVRIYKIPVMNEVKKKFFFIKKYKSYPLEIFININFGKYGITKLEAN